MTLVASAPHGIARFLPAITWVRGYDRAWLRRDVVGGLAAGAVVIPQAMAYASVADLPPEVGLYTCMVPMVVYVVLGGSRTLSLSTTSTVAVLTGSTLVTAGVAADANDPARALATLSLLVGLILIVARFLRLGAIVDNISEATLTGIKIGVGLTVAAGQLPKLLGVAGAADADAFVSEVRGVLADLSDISWATVAFSAATLTVLVVLGRVLPRIPAPLVVVALGIAAVRLWSLNDHGIALVPPVPSGLPTPIAPDLDLVANLLGGAFAIAVMCFLETASVAAAVRRRHEPPIDNNQELLANGASCALGGAFRAMPSAGGFSQTAINAGAGSRTQLSELVTALLAVASALFLGALLSDLPEATLGSMVMVAVIGLIRPSELLLYWRVDPLSFWVAIATAAAGLLLGLLPAVLIGVVLTLLLVLHELNSFTVTEMRPPSGNRRGELRPAEPGSAPVPGLLILRLDGPLYAANVRHACRALLDDVAASNATTVILDASAAATTSITVLDHVVEVERQLDEQGVRLWIAALPPRTLATSRRHPRWPDLVANGQLYPTVNAARVAYEDALK
jgi:high affinity sulfate transporter 1